MSPKRIQSPAVICALLLLLTGAGALAFRLPALSLRPMHTDEAVHAVKVGILMDTGAYIYNPHEYHGPTPYYFSLPFIWLSGAKSFAEIPGEWPLRIVSAIFGASLIILLLMIADGLGYRAAACAGVFTAVSPALVFYSRYYIQETLLIFFALGAIACAWRYAMRMRLAWALLAGFFLGMMHATKETSIIFYAAMLFAAILTMLWSRMKEGYHPPIGDYIHHWHAIGAIKVAAVVAIVILTGFLSNPAATIDALSTYAPYIARAGSGDSSMGHAALHSHPWHYYLLMLIYFKSAPGPWWSEALILALGIVGIGSALFAKKHSAVANVHLTRFLSFYTIFNLIAFSLIPYKTPWNMLGFFHGMTLLAGVGAVAILDLLENRIWKATVLALLLIGAAHLGWQAYRANYIYYADTRNPYVYAHTSTDYGNLVKRMNDLAKVHPKNYQMLVKVAAPGDDYWPLPWDLRRFENVGFWNEAPPDPDADVIIAAEPFEQEINARINNEYQKEFYGLRPEVLLVVYIEKNLWDAFIETRK